MSQRRAVYLRNPGGYASVQNSRSHCTYKAGDSGKLGKQNFTRRAAACRVESLLCGGDTSIVRTRESSGCYQKIKLFLDLQCQERGRNGSVSVGIVRVERTLTPRVKHCSRTRAPQARHNRGTDLGTPDFQGRLQCGPKRASVRTGSELARWNALRNNPAPWARKSLAQHGAAGGVLGSVGNGSESRRDDGCSHTPSKRPALPSAAFGPLLVD